VVDETYRNPLENLELVTGIEPVTPSLRAVSHEEEKDTTKE
jgi:hypothetical protein